METKKLYSVSGEKILVFGTGVSGLAAARFLHGQGAQLWVYDHNEQLDREKTAEKIGNHFSARQIVTGAVTEDLLQSVRLCIVSPGVPLDSAEIQYIYSHGIEVISEVELAYRYGKGKLVAITGTNGKTTTTALTGHILKEAGFDTRVVGNIGAPYIDEVLTTTQDSVCVAELSSFQLESISTMRPHISAVLNITPDHLNRHHTMEEYAAAKERISENQTEDDFCILNYEDDRLREMAQKMKAQVVWFSSKRRVERGGWIDGKVIYADLDGGEPVILCHVDELRLLGIHNYENVMAAALAALLYGADMPTVARAVKSFAGVAHRIEYVDEVGGVAFYNDSKGTNPDAAIRAVRAMNRPTVLIGGGYDKDSEYDEWIGSFGSTVRLLVLTGQTKEKIRDCAFRHGFTNVVLADTFEEAFEKAYENTKPGDALLLSPACASWGMFDNYEQRGDVFKKLVAGLDRPDDNGLSGENK